MRNIPHLFHKLASLFLVLLALSIVLPSSTNAQTCTVNCLRVYSIQLRDLGSSVGGTVKLTDESGGGAGSRSAVVHAVWTRPDGTVFNQYDVIGTRLRAEFRLATGGVPGTYTLTVVDASKSGYTFDPVNSRILSDSITIGGTANQPPVAVPNADILSGGAPLLVNFDASWSTDPDGVIVAYAWNFGDGNTSTGVNPTHTYTTVGSFNATLTVTDDRGATVSNSITITVTNSDAGCTSNCMSVDQITLRYNARRGRLKGLVDIVDENGNGVRKALVRAQWTRPDGSTVDQYVTTNWRNRAKFILDAATARRYTLRIVEVTLAGYTFDPDSSNVLSDSIDVMP